MSAREIVPAGLTKAQMAAPATRQQVLDWATRIAVNVGKEVYQQLNDEHTRQMAELEAMMRAEMRAEMHRLREEVTG